MKQPRPRIAILFAAVAALGGCAVVPARDYGYEPAPAVTVYAAPPAPLVEYRGLSPAYGYVWLDGYWNWGGVHYVWIPGRWVNPPPGQVWVPRVWQRDGDRWHSYGGQWQQHREDRRLPPQPVWPRREFQPQPQPFQQPSELRRWPEPQPPLPGAVQPVQRRPEIPQLRPGETRPQPPALRQEPSPRPGEAAPQRRGPDEGRRPNRGPQGDGDQRERH